MVNHYVTCTYAYQTHSLFYPDTRRNTHNTTQLTNMQKAICAGAHLSGYGTGNTTHNSRTQTHIHIQILDGRIMRETHSVQLIIMCSSQRPHTLTQTYRTTRTRKHPRSKVNHLLPTSPTHICTNIL